jgi:hypothetical protein
LSLFVFRIRADHAHHAFAVDDLAVVAHLFNGSPYFHNPSTFSTGISGLDSNRRESPTGTRPDKSCRHPTRFPIDLKLPVSANCGY